MTKRQLPSNEVVETVEDSEPEREELRKRRKEERRKRRQLAKQSNLELIELTDSDSAKGSDSHHEKATKDDANAPLAPGSLIDVPSSSEITNDSNDEIVLPKQSSQASVILTNVEYDSNGSDESEVEERTMKMRTKLGSFSFSTASQTSNGSMHIARHSVRVIRPSKGTAIRRQGHTASGFYLDFSERQLKSLLKCVSCDLKWTALKAATSKATHMRTCAKKMHLTDETMRVLILREVQAVSQQIAETQSNRKQVPESPPKTFLEHVKENSYQCRGKRRKQVESSLRIAKDSRLEILDCARSILERPLTRGSHGENDTESQFTQPLGKSGLGAQSSLTLSFTNDEEELPLTQQLPKSNLGSAVSKCCQALDLIGEPPIFNSPPASQSSSPSEVSPVGRIGPSILASIAVGDVVSPSSPPLLSPLYQSLSKQTLVDQSVYDFEDAHNIYDDAILTFEPDVRNEDVGDRTLNDRRSVMGQVATEKTRPILTRKRNTNKHKGKDADNDFNDPGINDDELFAKFTDMVLEDKVLYRRVLLYEPILFDVFCEAATERAKEYNLRPVPLRTKLRIFLDKQAIHYYGHELGSWNRR